MSLKNLVLGSDLAKERSPAPLKTRNTGQMPQLQHGLYSPKPLSLTNTLSSTHLESLKKGNLSIQTNTAKDTSSRILNSDLRDKSQSSFKERNAIPVSLRPQLVHRSLLNGSHTEDDSRDRSFKEKGSKGKLEIIPPKPRIKQLSPLKSPAKELWESKVLPLNDMENGLSQKNLLRSYTKKYLTAQKIARVFTNTKESLGDTQTSKKLLEDDQNTAVSEYGLVNAPILEKKEDLHMLLQSIEYAIMTRKTKPELEKHLERIVEIAQKIKYPEFHLAALKTQGKVMFMYSDLFRAIGIFKTLKHFADFNNSFRAKLKAYKYLAVCFHRVENYKRAIFYNIKMLQTAWLCNSKRYELLAYDRIGIEYYYQGNLDKANYYHERMMSGNVEAPDSKLRELGIDKLLHKMAENRLTSRKNIQVVKPEEELDDHNLPPSEDEFELPSPRNQRPLGTEFTGNHESRGTSPSKKRRTFLILNKMVNGHLSERKPTRSKATFSTEGFKEDNNLSIGRFKKDLINAGPVNNPVLLSHLSPNRLLSNFQPKDAQHIMNAYISRGNDSDESFIVLDSKSLEEVRKKLEKLKKQTETLLNEIYKIEQARQTANEAKEQKVKFSSKIIK